jgi:hypothetical protein
MAVMVTFTLKTDEATYQRLHSQLLAVARPAGLLFHSAHEVDGGIGIVDFWPSEQAFQNFMGGPAGQGLSAAGIAQPDDLKFTTAINAGG